MGDRTIATATYDIHLASDVMSNRVLAEVEKLGFNKDDFIGGTTGVVHPCHYSFHPATRKDMEATWRVAVDTLSQATVNDFYGYAEAEVTPAQFRRRFEWKPFDASVSVPFATLSYQECPPGKYKDLDVHVSIDLKTIDPRLQEIMEKDLSLHYVDIRKSEHLIIRVYTFQPMGVKEAPKLFHHLASFLEVAGGFQGKMKLESTFAFGRFPSSAPVCPVVTAMPQIFS